MLIGNTSSRPNIANVRRIKRALQKALNLDEDATLTVTQLACLEEDCAPLETVIGLLLPGMPQRQHKVHKPTDSITAQDLLDLCTAWGVVIESSFFDPYFLEN